ncbi:MAG: PAC2 family protein, partial [Nanoarchaeota archaeon]
MEIKLWKKPKNCTIIEGFPGFGLVGTIATEFLIEHLKTEQIGKILFNDMPAMVAIHENKLVEPLGVFYNQKYNVVLLHAITAATHYEWEMADTIKKLSTSLGAKEIISLEGVGSGQES